MSLINNSWQHGFGSMIVRNYSGSNDSDWPSTVECLNTKKNDRDLQQVNTYGDSKENFLAKQIKKINQSSSVIKKQLATEYPLRELNNSRSVSLNRDSHFIDKKGCLNNLGAKQDKRVLPGKHTEYAQPLETDTYWQKQNVNIQFNQYSDELNKYQFNNSNELFYKNRIESLDLDDFHAVEKAFVNQSFNIDMLYLNNQRAAAVESLYVEEASNVKEALSVKEALNFTEWKRNRKFKNPESALHVSSVSVLKQQEPSSVFDYVVLLKWLADQGQYERCMKIISEMSRNQFKPDSYAFDPIIKLLVDRNDEKGLLELAAKMEMVNVQPGVSYYSALICFYAKQEELNMAMVVFRTAVSEAIMPNILICNYLIEVLLKHNKNAEAMEVSNYLDSIGLGVNPKFYSSLKKVKGEL